MDYEFTDIFDIPALTKICEGFTDYTGMATALLDLEGTVHIATGWQDICTKFHRVNPETACRCTESDTALAGMIHEGASYNVYSCKNGLVDVAVPVTVDNQHIGNLFTGQFFFEPPDIDYFIAQARRFGFDEENYINALERVPVFRKSHVSRSMDLLIEITQEIGTMGMERLRNM